MPHHIVIERFRPGNSRAVHARFAEKGRRLPDGLHYLDSWLAGQDDTCFRLMQTDRPETFDKWVRHWDDLVDFEMVELKEKPNRER